MRPSDDGTRPTYRSSVVPHDRGRRLGHGRRRAAVRVEDASPAATDRRRTGSRSPTAEPKFATSAAGEPKFKHAASSDASRPALRPKAMVWIPGGTFWMGADDSSMPDAKPVHEVTRLRVLDGSDRGHQPPVRPVRRGDRLRHGRRARTRPQGISRRAGRRSSSRARSSSRRRRAGSLSTIPWSGGATFPVPTGGIPRARAARSTGKTTIRSSTFAGTTPSLTPTGPASGCRPRPSGNARRAAESLAPATSGATSFCPGGNGRPTSGKGISPIRTAPTTALPGPRRSARSPPTASACSTWPATSGNGAPTGIGPEYQTAASDNPTGPAVELRPQRAGRSQARPARRLVPVQRPVLHALPSRRAGQRRARQRRLARGISVRALTVRRSRADMRRAVGI